MILPKRHRLERLVVHDARNLERVVLEPAARVNVISGNNGQGKTSLLEAIYLLATTRSFRTSRLVELVRHGEKLASVRGSFEETWPEATLRREQSVGLEGGRRTVRLDGEAPASLAYYATRSPVVVFDPQQMALSTGPASERRTLLDRVTLFTEPGVGMHRARYARALRERQRLLMLRSTRLAESRELDAYERILAEHGAFVTAARRRACDRLAEVMRSSFAAIAAPDLILSVAYEPAGLEDVEEALAGYRDQRARDAQQRRTRLGPHRDDLALAIDGHPARVVASQGQHRAITLALKLAELRCIADARGLLPILLLDDVSSELDADRSAALFAHLGQTESQIFLTTTRRDLIVTTSAAGLERRDFRVAAGTVQVVETT